MRLKLSMEEWWAAQTLAGGSAKVPAWIEELVRESVSEEVERQRRIVQERSERHRREHSEFYSSMEAILAALSEPRPS